LLPGFLAYTPPLVGDRIINPSNTLPYAFYQAPEFNYSPFVPHGTLTPFTMAPR
jgi:hypothetical protein